MDISNIPTVVLERDLQDSHNDILACASALSQWITSYSGGSVQERLEANKRFVKVISEELDRRSKIEGK
jgi:hypothetical protein